MSSVVRLLASARVRQNGNFSAFTSPIHGVNVNYASQPPLSPSFTINVIKSKLQNHLENDEANNFLRPFCDCLVRVGYPSSSLMTSIRIGVTPSTEPFSDKQRWIFETAKFCNQKKSRRKHPSRLFIVCGENKKMIRSKVVKPKHDQLFFVSAQTSAVACPILKVDSLNHSNDFRGNR